jgi:cystathionine beta-lyase/cystathionine gamma-synthase
MPDHDDAALHAETRAIRAGRKDNDTALAPILWASSTFIAHSVEESRQMATSAGPVRFYSRYGNPTVAAFEEAIADLEGAEAARAFASGMGAVSAVILGLCSKGDHIVAQRQLYAGTQLLLQTACPRFGIDVTFVDGTEPGAFAAAVRPGKTVLVYA